MQFETFIQVLKVNATVEGRMIIWSYSELVRAAWVISSTFMHVFQNNLEQLFGLKGISAM